MSKALIQTVNAGPQAVEEMGVISLGSTVRRFGCNLRQSGDAIECAGCGYYTVTATVIAAPTAAGVVTVELYQNGVAVPGAIASATVATADSPVTLPLVGSIRLACEETATLTFVLTEGSGTVENIAVRVQKA